MKNVSFSHSASNMDSTLNVISPACQSLVKEALAKVTKAFKTLKYVKENKNYLASDEPKLGDYFRVNDDRASIPILAVKDRYEPPDNAFYLYPADVISSLDKLAVECCGGNDFGACIVSKEVASDSYNQHVGILATKKPTEHMTHNWTRAGKNSNKLICISGKACLLSAKGAFLGPFADMNSLVDLAVGWAVAYRAMHAAKPCLESLVADFPFPIADMHMHSILEAFNRSSVTATVPAFPPQEAAELLRSMRLGGSATGSSGGVTGDGNSNIQTIGLLQAGVVHIGSAPNTPKRKKKKPASAVSIIPHVASLSLLGPNQRFALPIKTGSSVEQDSFGVQ